MTPLAIIAKEAGITVSGSDVDEKFITDVPLEKAGIIPQKGFSEEHVGSVDLVITTNAHGGFDNPEVVAARKKHIPILTKGEAVGCYMEGSLLGTSYKGVSVSGTHGKTTTSAMLATIGKLSGSDPGYLIGTSDIPSLDGMPGHFGSGSYFIAEADEYITEPNYKRIPQFMFQHPQILLITNIDHDHPDVYETIDDVRNAFLAFAGQLSDKSTVILCGDSEQAAKFKEAYEGTLLTYGFSPSNDYVVTKYQVYDGIVTFTLKHHDVSVTDITLRVGGEHNALNASAALLGALMMGIPISTISKALRFFTGTKRRLEYRGKLSSGCIVYDDYAHHPTEITSSLRSLKQLYPDRRILCIFQPHTYSRTKQLFTQFARSFSDADTVLLLPIFASAREGSDPEVSSELLGKEMKKHGTDVLSFATHDDVIEYIDRNHLSDNTLLVTMGAGDVYTLLDDLGPILPHGSTDQDEITGKTRKSDS